MLRAIFKRTYWEGPNQPISETYTTIDFEAPEVEDKLRDGGTGMNVGHFTNLIGIEYMENTKKNGQQT